MQYRVRGTPRPMDLYPNRLWLIAFLNAFPDRRTDSRGYVVRKEARLLFDSADHDHFLSIYLLLTFADIR